MTQESMFSTSVYFFGIMLIMTQTNLPANVEPPHLGCLLSLSHITATLLFKPANITWQISTVVVHAGINSVSA